MLRVAIANPEVPDLESRIQATYIICGTPCLVEFSGVAVDGGEENMRMRIGVRIRGGQGSPPELLGAVHGVDRIFDPPIKRALELRLSLRDENLRVIRGQLARSRQ